VTDFDPVVADFAEHFPDQFSHALGAGRHDQVSALIGTLPPGLVAAVAARLPAPSLLALLESPVHAPQTWLEAASFDDAVMLLSRMRRERRLALINSINDRGRRQQLLRHEQYPAHTVGSLVEDVLLRIDKDRPMSAVVDELRKLDRDDPPLLVVVDAAGRYAGILKPWQLIGSRSAGRRPGELARFVQPVVPETPIAAAAAHEGWLEHDWLPVIDNQERVIGAITRKTVLRAASRATTARHGTESLMLDIVGGVTLLLGSILDGLLTKRST
jgi:Mg/Co/Ni transporter MgtE